ncbi:MAG: cation:proton antiporter [Clostridia bacterium]|nr:cation:proton antiporter [Clostridia bacterium]
MNVLLSLAILLITGLAMSRLVKLANLPNVTGYLVGGLLIGPVLALILGSEEGLISHEMMEGFKILTSLALGFIAFSIGGEFKLSAIKKIGGKVITITFLQAFGAMFMVMIGLFIVQLINPTLIDTPTILLLSAIATATAPAATLMVVRQYKAKGAVTDALLPVVAFDDAIGLMLFSICFAIADVVASGAALTFETAVLAPLYEIGMSVLVGSAVGFVLGFMMKFFKSRANRLCLMLTSVLVGVGLSDLMGLSSLLTCMMIGALFANTRGDAIKILDGQERWTPPLFMLFFVLSGVELDLTVIPVVGVVGVVYIVTRCIGKYFGARIGGTITKADKNVRKYLGIALFPQAGVAIGMAQLVQASDCFLPMVKSAVLTVVLSATLIYELVGPVLTKIALTRAGEIKKEKEDNTPTASLTA